LQTFVVLLRKFTLGVAGVWPN